MRNSIGTRALLVGAVAGSALAARLEAHPLEIKIGGNAKVAGLVRIPVQMDNSGQIVTALFFNTTAGETDSHMASSLASGINTGVGAFFTATTGTETVKRKGEPPIVFQ